MNADRMPSDLLPRVTTIGFEKRYSDDSGVEFGVYLEGGSYRDEGYGVVVLKAVDTVSVPAQHIDWLIGCLTRIRAEIADRLTVKQTPND